jgi:hypothetical protein
MKNCSYINSLCGSKRRRQEINFAGAGKGGGINSKIESGHYFESFQISAEDPD